MPIANTEVPVGTFFPNFQTLDAIGNVGKIRRAFDRVSNRSEKDVRIGLLDVLDGGVNVGELLSLVTPHQEHSGLDSNRPAKGNRCLHLLHSNSALHGVEDSLRAALRADPNAEASHLSQGLNNLQIQAVGSRNAFKRQFHAAAFEFGGILKEPSMMNRENVVGHPRHLRLIAVNEPLELIGYRCWLSAAMGLSKNLVAAPAAMVGTSSRGDQ